jgi:hypothetical protein
MKKNIVSLLVLIIIIVLGWVAYVFISSRNCCTPESEITPPNSTYYKSPSGEYEIQLPKDWVVTERLDYGFVRFSPPQKGVIDVYVDNGMSSAIQTYSKEDSTPDKIVLNDREYLIFNAPLSTPKAYRAYLTILDSEKDSYMKIFVGLYSNGISPDDSVVNNFIQSIKFHSIGLNKSE